MKPNELQKLQEAYNLIGEIIAYNKGVNDYANIQRSQFKLVYVNPNPPSNIKKKKKEMITNCR